MTNNLQNLPQTAVSRARGLQSRGGCGSRTAGRRWLFRATVRMRAPPHTVCGRPVRRGGEAEARMPPRYPRFEPWREMPPLWPEALLGPRPLAARTCMSRGAPMALPLPPFAHASLPGFFAIDRLSLDSGG